MNRRRLLGTIASLVLVGCSGAGAASKTPGEAPAKSAAPHDSIAEAAAAQGGLASLGGAGNREESTGTEVSFSGPLRAESLSKKNPPKLDGVLKEWHARTPATETLKGSTDGLTLDVAVQSGDDVLWLAAEVNDATLTRSPTHATNEDHVRFTIAFPAGRGILKAYEIGLWPGIPGSAPGAVKWTTGPNAGQAVAGAKVVENDVKGGVTLEATIPWASFPNAVRVGMRAAFRYHDAGGGVLGTGYGSVEAPTELPPLPIPAEHAVASGLLEQRGLASTKPKIDLYPDLAGDERKERVSVFGPFFTICGPGYRKGRQFFWREVAGEIVSLEAAPALAGRAAKDDLVVRRRVTQNHVAHEILEVWSIPTDKEEPITLFAHEIAIATEDGKRRVSNAARVGARNGVGEIEITTEPPTGWDGSSFAEASATGSEPLLLPWGPVKSRTFKLEGGRFVKASEVAQASTQVASAKPAASPAPEAPNDAPSPPVTKGHDLSKQVLEAYVRDAKLGASDKPRFDLEVNVDGDSKPERVVVFGRDVVVLGPAFKNGTGYTKLTLAQLDELTEVSARDLTGDGAAEILVRGTRRIKAPNGDPVAIDALFVYQVRNGAIGRVLSIETGRDVSGKKVQGLVQFIPSKSGKAFDVEAKPGPAKGFTSSTYPFPEEKPGTGPMEPLLLPWGTVQSARYSWNGKEFALVR